MRKPLLEITDEEFDRVVDLNLKGIFRLVREFGRGMVERGSGSIIAFSSIRVQVVEPGQGVYAATKAGTLQMLQALSCWSTVAGRPPMAASPLRCKLFDRTGVRLDTFRAASYRG